MSEYPSVQKLLYELRKREAERHKRDPELVRSLLSGDLRQGRA